MFSIKLDGIANFMVDGCLFSVSRFWGETSKDRGSTADLAIVVTGKSGRFSPSTTHHHPPVE